MTRKWVVGINTCSENNAATLSENGKIIFGLEEERLSRKKFRKKRIPEKSIRLIFEKFTINPKQAIVSFTGKAKKAEIKDFFEREIGKGFQFAYFDEKECNNASAVFPEKSSNAIVFSDETGVMEFWKKSNKLLGLKEQDSWKVMGMAAYGKPKENFPIKNKLILNRFDFAATLQKKSEQLVLERIQELKGTKKRLCIAGELGLNCLINSVIQKEMNFEKIYIQPASQQSGKALGANFLAIKKSGQKSKKLNTMFLGPEFSGKEIKAELERQRIEFRKSMNIAKESANLIADSKVVGWFQGKMEFGPRALGNRSILGDPRKKKTRTEINRHTKHREMFRPLAPSVLAEKAMQWFEIPKTKSSGTDYMLFAYPVRKEKRKLIPAVIHADRTSRIQTVSKKTNPKFYKLIKEFEKLTGIPMVLNTSFNDSEPIVCTPRDAINTFLKTKIDVLAIGNYLTEKN